MIPDPLSTLTPLQRQLIMHEGLRLFPYTDTTGNLSIGVGRNLTDHGISRPEAIYLMGNDIEIARAALMRNLPTWLVLNNVRQRVLLDMCYNLGIKGLLGFHQMLDAAINGDYEAAAQAMLSSKWASQVGQRASRLAQMMRTGEDVCDHKRPTP